MGSRSRCKPKIAQRSGSLRPRFEAHVHLIWWERDDKRVNPLEIYGSFGPLPLTTLPVEPQSGGENMAEKLVQRFANSSCISLR